MIGRFTCTVISVVDPPPEKLVQSADGVVTTEILVLGRRG